MKKHLWPIALGFAGLFAIATAFGTGGDSPAEQEDDGVVLGEEDLADRAEILRNMYRRITPPDMALRQDVGTWSAAWEEFGANWDSAAADREYGAWVVPVEVTQDAGATLVKDGNGAVLWRGWTDFARPESADVVLTGGLVAEDDWPLYEGTRDAVTAMTAETSRANLPGRTRTAHTNGLRFTSHEWTSNDTFRLELAYETDTNVDVFAYAMACTSSLVVATWTNDENLVITDTNTVWTAVGLPFNGMESDWELRGTVAISNGVAEFEDSGFSEELSRLRFYAAAVAKDTDGDGLNDGWEGFVSHTDPGNQDSDGDGVPDGMDTMPATSNVWFEVVHSKTNYFLQELGWVENNAPEVPFNDWSWVVSDQPPTSDSVLEDVRVSGYADDYITVDFHPINHTRGPYTYNNWHIMNQINDLESLQFTMRLVDWPDANYAGSNVVCVGRSDAEPFEVEWEWKVPMALTGPEYVCVGDSAQFEAGGAGGGPYTWSVSYEGTTPVAEIDEYGMLTALAPGIATVTVMAGEVYSVSQAVNVVQIDFLVGGGNMPASELKIAKWENAFTMVGTNVAVKDNFIDLDPDRFCIRVTDLSQAGASMIGMDLSTDSAGSFFDDDANGLELHEQSPNSGIFISTNLLLVADDIDDDFTQTGVPADDVLNDRTHKIVLNGKVRVRYPVTEDAWVGKELPVNIAGAVHVIPILLPGTSLMEWDVNEFLESAKRKYAQIGVTLTWDYPVVRNPPAGMNLTNGLTVRTLLDSRDLSDDAKAIISEVGTVGDISDIHLIYVNRVKVEGAIKGGCAIAPYWYNTPGDHDYLYNIFVTADPDPEKEGCVIAHELGHLLTNTNHVPEKWMLMYDRITLPSDIRGTRRFNSNEEIIIQGDSHVHQMQ